MEYELAADWWGWPQNCKAKMMQISEEKLDKTEEKYEDFEMAHWPVLVELDGKVSHVLQSLVGEAHIHIHVTLAAREGSRDLQSLCFDCRKPDLIKTIQLNFQKGANTIRSSSIWPHIHKNFLINNLVLITNQIYVVSTAGSMYR